MPSNDCLLLVLSFLFDRFEAFTANLSLLNRQARAYFKKEGRDPLRMFVKAERSLLVAYNTDWDFNLLSKRVRNQMNLFRTKLCIKKGMNKLVKRAEEAECSEIVARFIGGAFDIISFKVEY
mmetsp:Transcript_8026/g.5995  ORF Transcript_8026/g.5995 Transcript_8026/m.5995 type:complete len:122 (-) Transcript_8026:791-1156(-)